MLQAAGRYNISGSERAQEGGGHTAVTRGAAHELRELLGNFWGFEHFFDAPPIPKLRIWIIHRVFVILRRWKGLES